MIMAGKEHYVSAAAMPTMIPEAAAKNICLGQGGRSHPPLPGSIKPERRGASRLLDP